MDDGSGRAMRRLTGDNGEGLPRLVFFVFAGFGALMALGGLALVWSDPAGLVMIAVGALFAAIGWSARKIFAPPVGMKHVPAESQEAPITTHVGLTGARTQTTLITVPEDAGPEEIAAARAAWRESRVEVRPDWREGRIQAEAERSGGMLKAAAIAWGGFAALTVGAALIWGGVAWLVAAGAVGVATLLGWQVAAARARARKFGAARLALSACPVAPGHRLEGVLESGAARRDLKDDHFTLTLSCVNRWEETFNHGPNDHRPTRHHRETIWRREATVLASGEDALTAKVSFDLPADQPGATLGALNEGIAWELEVTAAAPGVDYHARFILPVLDPAPLTD